MWRYRRRCRTALAMAVVVAQSMGSGCMFRGVRRDVAFMRRVASIRGSVMRDAPDRGDILVVLYAPGASEAADVFTLLGPGRYLFTVPAGAYRIVAFEDVN